MPEGATLTDDAGGAFDLECTAAVPATGRLEIHVLATPDGRERTVVFIDGPTGTAGIDTRNSALTGDGAADVFSAPIQAREGVPIRVLRDGSIVEAFVNGMAFTVRVIPTLADASSIRLVTAGDAVKADVEAWEMSPDAVEFT